MKIVEPDKCCGCRACFQACPKSAIQIITDIQGFEQVTIDENDCINCGKCKSVCPIINENKVNGRLLCGSGYCKDEKIKTSGSSGGLFGLFSRTVIKNGGVVYAAAFDEQLQLKTTRVESIKGLDSLYKSKYLLCDTSNIFHKIQKDLENDITVLYCSSPCQISALKNFLHKEYESLLCIEFICHGVGSQRQFDDSIRYIEKKKKIKILKFSFRDKYKSASSHYYRYDYLKLSTGKKKTKRNIYMTFPYYYAYQERITCRQICYSCPYATENRTGDITIGDFHEINKYEPNVDRFSGVSMFVCNTPKGYTFFNSIRDQLVVKEYEWGIIRENNRFSGIEIPPNRRKEYLAFLAEGKTDAAYSKYLTFWKDWRYYYYHMPKMIRQLGNRILRRSK